MAVELKENTEQSSTPKQQDIQINSVESFLQQKISDSQTQEKLIPIFNDIKKDIPENDILSFLNNRSLNPFLRKTKTLSPQDTKNFFSNEIVDYLQTIGKSVSVVVKENFEVSNDNEIASDADKKRQETRDEYDKLDDKFKANADQIADRKVKMQEKGVLKQLDQFPEEKINQFVSFSYTANNFSDMPEVENFKEKYKELKATSSIIENAYDLKSTESADTLLQMNDDLGAYAEQKDAPVFKDVSKFNYFEQMTMGSKDFWELLKFADKKTQKILYEQKKILLGSKYVDRKLQARDDTPPEIKDKLKTYNELLSSTLNEIKTKLQEDSQSMIRQRVLASTIQWLASYFDGSTVNNNNFAEQFDINAAKGFSIDKDVLHMQGKIGDADIGFYYHLNDSAAQLQSDDSMYFDPISKTFALGPETWWVSDMGVRMPTLAFLSEKATDFSSRRVDNILKNSRSMDEFQQTFKNKLSEHLMKYFGKENIVHNRVEKQVQKNLTAQDILANYFPSDIASKKITTDETPEAHELLGIFDNTLENDNTQNISSLHGLQKRFKNALDNDLDVKNPKLEDSRKTLLSNTKGDLWSDKTDQHRWTQLLSCMKKFAPEGKLNLEDFDWFITTLEKGESINENLSKFSPNFQTTYDQAMAEQLLKNIPGEGETQVT